MGLKIKGRKHIYIPKNKELPKKRDHDAVFGEFLFLEL
ncbi:hypothetical protein B4135_2910 [Caldibacillus debilis]|uniref:Uncharacterized protein n=1 Tax=Caldibacillus debilis TaxID=301148 RepID=A0A150LLV2_9BACI|nr:hypothetical protein B4135_2910 [Caldibacillus debilis]